MRRAVGAFLAGVLLAPSASAAALDAIDEDGWYTWRVEAAEDAPAWCCFDWRCEVGARRGCRLDRENAYGNCGDAGPPDGTVQVYAQASSGETVRLRVLSPACPVEAEGSVSDLGEVDVDESFEWLRRLVRADSSVLEDAVAAIAMHRGEGPLRYLVEAANGGADGDIRKSAIFWLGQVRIPEAAGTIERLMFADDRADIRQHAAFVLAQSKAPDRTEALIRQGRQDSDGETRAQAWFWLAQTGAPESERAILQAAGNDPDGDVREEAVFALSQLPAERAVDALLAVLEDRRMHPDVREAALFWLAQSESDQAFAVIERLLTGGDAVRPRQ